MGKDVFVEKPMTLVASEAKRLTELAENSGLILQVGHIFRFDPA
jgi:predicted dehydrogenase